MTEIRVKKQIAAPAEEVFARATDIAGWPNHISAINKVEVLTDGPVGVGTRFRETRTMFGRDATEEMEITKFEPPHQYTLEAESHGCRYVTDHSFTSRDNGTEMEMVFSAQPLTLGAKVMGLLFRPFTKKMLESCSKDLEELKASLES